MKTATHVYWRATPGDWSRDNDLRPMSAKAWGKYKRFMLLKLGFDLHRPIKANISVLGFDIIFSQRLPPQVEKAPPQAKQEEPPAKLEDCLENFRDEDGNPFVVRCPSCKRENWAYDVATGQCAWCGWREEQ